MAEKTKKLDLEEMVVQPNPKIKTMMVLHIFNTHYNQGNQYSLKKDEIKVPAWSLKIQGKILAPDKIQDTEEFSAISGYLKMTHYLRKITIKFDKNEVDYPDLEWNKKTSKALNKDGIEIIREGNKELNIQIAIHINYSPKQYKLKPELLTIIGIKQCTKVEIITALWEYIKANRLQDQQDKQIINCNKEIKAICGEDRIEFSLLIDEIRKWLDEAEPEIINYKLKYFLIRLPKN